MLDHDTVINGEINTPFISQQVSDYLQTIFSAGYQLRIGTPQRVVNGGASESYALGFLSGMQEAAEQIRMMVVRQQEIEE